MRNKNLIIISIDADKALDEIQHHLIKTLKKVGLKVTFLYIVKATYEQPTANIILDGRKQKAFPLRSGMRQGYPILPVLFNIVLKILASTIRQKKKKSKLLWKK